jgi:putative oxidoreductase
VLILLGLFTRLAAIPLIVVMIVAIATAKRSEIGGLSDLLGFVEMLYIVLLSWLATAGPGPFSLDRLAVRFLETGGGRPASRAAAHN